MFSGNSVSLYPVSIVAKECKVEERTVTKWIRENRLPARKNGSGKWVIRSDEMKVFAANGNKMPLDWPAFDNKVPQDFDLFAAVDPKTQEETDHLHWEIGEIPGRKHWDQIQCFESMENGKTGWAMPKACKFPNDLQSRIALILELCPQYKRSYSNFMRDAFYNRILDIEHIMNARARKELDPKWEIHVRTQRIIQEKNDNEAILDDLLRAAKIVRASKSKREWRAFQEEYGPLVEARLTGRWKKFGRDILSGKLTKKSEREEKEESLWA